MPRHKSYLKESDLVFVAKKTEEELMKENEKKKVKTGFEIMYEQVSREHRAIIKSEKIRKSTLDNGRRKKSIEEPATMESSVIKAASLMQTAEEEQAVITLMNEARKAKEIIESVE